MKLLVGFAALLAVAAAQGAALGSFLGDAIGESDMYSGEACAAETMNAVKQCLATYYKNYDFDIAKMPKAMVYHLKLKTIMEKQGKEGITNVLCKNANPLNDCLNAIKSADSCQNVASYKEMLGLDESMDGASGYLITDVSLEYGCANEKAWLENYDCMNRTDVEHGDDFRKCVHDLKPVADKCVKLDQLLDCTTKIYTKECGEGIYGFICNLVERPVLALVTDCKGKLRECSAPKAAGYMALIPAMLLSLLPLVVERFA